jgi:integrase
VFTTASGRPIEPSNLNRMFSTLTKKAGLDHERVHNLRHTAATILRAYGGADLIDVKEILGHSTVAVTSDLYGHGVPPVACHWDGATPLPTARDHLWVVAAGHC